MASMSITRRSPRTGKLNTRIINCSPRQYQAWQNGTCIQDAMPNVSADDREFILTGFTPEDWRIMFVDPLYGPE